MYIYVYTLNDQRKNLSTKNIFQNDKLWQLRLKLLLKVLQTTLEK